MADVHSVSGTKGTARQSKTSMVRSTRTRSTEAKATKGANTIASSDSPGEGKSASKEAEMTDSSGNTVFILCILAFVLTAVGLGLFLWRKYKQSKAIGRNEQAAQTGEAAEAKSGGLAGLFKRKKDRPTPLPLSTLRNPNDPALPPYSPFAAGAGQSPWMGGNFTMQTAQAAAAQAPADDDSSDAKSLRSIKSTNKARREAAERAGNPFSPFAPFSPVNVIPPAESKVRTETRDDEEASEDEEELRPSKSRGNGNLHPSSAYHHSVTLPRPSPVRYMDPESAQAMGIHPDVIKRAEPGISEDEIERRRARAQRRLEERQRAEEGSIVEDNLSGSRFSEFAGSRRN